MQAMCGGHHQIFSYASTTGTLQEGSHVGTGWICEHLCTRRVSLRYRTGIALGFGTGENLETKEQFQALHANMNEPIKCKVSLLVVHHIAFHGLEPLPRQKSASQEDSYNNTFASIEQSTPTGLYGKG